MPTSECQLVTKTNAGHHMSSVTIAAALLKLGLEERRGQCVSLSPVSGVSPQTMSRTAISVWWTQQNEEKGGIRLTLSTLTFCHVLHLFPITRRPYLCHSLHCQINLVQQKKQGMMILRRRKVRHLLRAVDAGWLVKGAPTTPTKRTSMTSSENWP